MTHFLSSLSPHSRELLKGLTTPYYLIDENKIIENLKKIDTLCALSGAKALLALKCYATWATFDAMRPYLHGTTSSSLFEVRLGREKFGGETHAYSVAYSDGEIAEVLDYADKIIFNSLSQLQKFSPLAHAKDIPVGLRINPNTSNSSFVIADPARPFSRLGESEFDKIWAIKEQISGVMIHYNCENDSFEHFRQSLDVIEHKFGELFYHLDWVSLGGGIHFIGEDYPLNSLATRLKEFANKYDVQVYLEPGEASVHQSAVLVTSVLDVMENGKPLAVVDASIEAHMLDLLIYRQSAPLSFVNDTDYHIDGGELENDAPNQKTRIYGKSCLAGDIFGEFELNEPLQVGDKVAFGNAAPYTMVKKNWFNGVDMPSIVIINETGCVKMQRCFDYEDYVNSLS